ncbi:MAG TPA: hypothetical protein VE861_01880 [Gemmatimonadaceae bacterium]|nr:hypothetical protein [Gemmatimonadaceae bacterium]
MRRFRMGLTALLAAQTVALAVAPASWSLLDNVNLPVHETGHLVLAAFGETLQLLGGTLLQLGLPLIFAGYFAVHRDEHAASVCVWWVGQNCINVATYMADAIPMELPLVGGGEHDWNLLFTHWGVLGNSITYARLTHGSGVLLMTVATMWGIIESLRGPGGTPAAAYPEQHAT